MKKKAASFPKNRILKIIAIFIALGILFGFYVFKIQSPVEQMVGFRVEKGASVSSVAAGMKEKNIIYSENVFKASVLLLGGRVQSGEYDVPARASTWQVAKILTRGDVAATLVVIPEGLTVKQIKQLLLDNAALTGNVDCDASQHLTDASDAPDRVDVCHLKDGDLFPDTYRVAKGTSRLDVLALSKKKMDSIRIGWENSGKSMPHPLKSWNEVITLASIVQKETPKASEMPIVASVYLNRLRKTMKLQADPTVVYAITNGLGDMGGKGLFRGHLKTKSPYNTYIKYGLPPAPIANVGRDAIAAVLTPADTNYLFFVADGQGGHRFARSYEEHQKNHANWREIRKLKNDETVK